jgi:protein TonB
MDITTVASPPPASLQYGGQPLLKRSENLTGAIIAVALHAIAIIALLQYEPVRSALINATPLMVSLITPPVEKPAVLPKPLPVKPKLVKPVEPPPVLAAATDAPSPYVAPPPPPVPVPVEIVAPPAPPAPPAPVRVIPPNFNADYLKNPPPVYPATARRQGQQGRVMLRVLVNTAGTADRVEIRNSSGHGLLDGAALDAVRQWKFVPARQGDQPIAAWVIVPITFTLEG